MQLQSFLAARSTQLIIAVSGIYFSYIATGVIQERLFISDYSSLNREPGTFPRFNYAFATSLFQNILSYLLAKLVNRYSKPSPTQMALKYKVMLGGLSFGTVFLTNQSMVYVSFLVQTITKSSKILSILLTSMLFGFKGHHTSRQYLCGLLITVGVIIFTLNQSKSVGGSSSIIGIATLLLSLLCDGLLGTMQEDVRQKYRPNKWEQMEALNKWGAIICFAVSVITWQLGGFIHYVKEQPYVIKDLAWMTILTTLGQIFVFYTLEHFSSFVLGIITTTRRFFTVLFSIVIYQHDMNAIQWIAIVLVFAGVFLEMTGKPKPQEKKFDELENVPRDEAEKLNEKVEVKVSSPK